MEINIHAGQRILYKDGKSGWQVGIINNGNAEVNEQGLWIPIIPLRFIDMKKEDIPYIQWAEINNIFTDGAPIEDWMKSSLMSKDNYIKLIQDEEFEHQFENAWVSDGEYYYYPVSKYTENWLMKQPFNYILRSY